MSASTPKAVPPHTRPYEQDYYGWLQDQLKALRDRRSRDLDWENLAEEVDDLGKGEKRRLGSNLELLLAHLLKWRQQPAHRSRSWTNSINEHRRRCGKILLENPSLKAALPELLLDAYEGARVSASEQTGLDLDLFPGKCPWSFEDSVDPEFWPD